MSCDIKIRLPCLTSFSTGGERGQAWSLGPAQLGQTRDYTGQNGKMNEKPGSAHQGIVQKVLPNAHLPGPGSHSLDLAMLSPASNKQALQEAS